MRPSRLRGEPVAVEQLCRRGTEADDRGDVLDAAPAGPLLGSADDQRREPQPSTDEERGGALRATELVCRSPSTGRRRAPRSRAARDRQPCTRRRARARRGRAPAATIAGAASAGFRPRGWRAGRDTSTVSARMRVEHRRRRSNRPSAVDADAVTSTGARLHASRTAECSTAVVTTCRGGRPRLRRATAGDGAPHRGVDRLGARRREHDLARSGAEQRGDLLAALLDRDPGDLALGVHPSRVGVVVAEIGEHRLERRRAQRRRRRVVEIGASHGPAPWDQTRATQWSSPSGRLASNCGDVSP